jgi:hypothetical protein
MNVTVKNNEKPITFPCLMTNPSTETIALILYEDRTRVYNPFTGIIIRRGKEDFTEAGHFQDITSECIPYNGKVTLSNNS